LFFVFLDSFCDISRRQVEKLLSLFSHAFPGLKMWEHLLTEPSILVIWAVTYPSTNLAQRCMTLVIKVLCSHHSKFVRNKFVLGILPVVRSVIYFVLVSLSNMADQAYIQSTLISASPSSFVSLNHPHQYVGVFFFCLASLPSRFSRPRLR
jgi:hypothetical protein